VNALRIGRGCRVGGLVVIVIAIYLLAAVALLILSCLALWPAVDFYWSN
jgi:hypothetical protein